MMLNFILFLLYLSLFIFAVIQETTFAMVFSLILVFLVACFLVISLGFEFLGYLILIVYVGAIAVLFLFMVMLFDRSEYKMFNITPLKENKFLIIILSILIAIFISNSFFEFIYSFSVEPLLLDNTNNILTLRRFNTSTFDINYKTGIDLIRSKFIETPHDINKGLIHVSDIELVGLSLYSDFFIPLLLAGCGLLVAMIGCIILTRSSFLKKKFRKTQIIEDQLNRYKL